MSLNNYYNYLDEAEFEEAFGKYLTLKERRGEEPRLTMGQYKFLGFGVLSSVVRKEICRSVEKPKAKVGMNSGWGFKKQ